ncbi:cysteine desulfurase family protein [Caldimonas tepidiphila]|uniref:cysteine desulfurase family protein n=1 Tax=Caldimonas tepidiphila TaxID=2315841 RepID=UPI000E5A225C|nr:cysteine desulfurase family protein [Caldimonas tepidiphila]
MDGICLDHNATTPPLPAVVQAVADCMSRCWANASSSHAPGQQARQRLAAARSSVARLLGCRPAEIVFTSGATEANHAALLGALGREPGRDRLVLGAVEHAGVMRLAQRLQDEGVRVDLIPVRGDGALDLEAARALMGADVALVSVLAANNETGVLMPLGELAALAHGCGAPLHTDATQWTGKLPFRFQDCGADLVSLSAHKLHGPKGVGALLVRQGLQWPALLAGSQERGRRGGTENLPGIAGFAAAAEALLAGPPLAERAAATAALRDALERELLARLPGTRVYGAACPRLPNTSYLRFGTLPAELVLARLERVGLVAAAGSACSSGGSQPSHVLLAMGVPRDEALCAVRLSLGATATRAEVGRVVARLGDALGPLLAEAARTACPPPDTHWRAP